MADPTYRLRLAPPDLARYPAPVRQQFHRWVVDLGLKAKDEDLAKGLDAKGKPLRAISARTRKYRRSAMTPDGKGDPKAPPLMPARALSRTRSLLAGRATPDAAIFYWRFDVFTGNSWGAILAIHRRKGRDVIGLSPAATNRVRAQAWAMWERFKRGEAVGTAIAAATAGPGIPRIGSTSTRFATYGINAQAPPKFLEGKATGGFTREEMRRYLTTPERASIPGRPARPYNRLLAHVWGGGGPAGPGAPKPPPKPKPKAPPGPKPAAAVEPGEFATIEHLEAWAARAFPGAAFHHAGIPLENWNRLAEELDELARDYPEVAARLEEINPPWIDWAKHPRARALSDVDGGKALAFRPDYWKRPWDELRAHQITDATSGWKPGGIFDPATAATHEWGHLLDAGLKKTDPARRRELGAVFEADGAFSPEIAEEVSQYAATDHEEAFAEAFLAARWQARSRQSDAVRRFKAILER